MSRLRQLHDRAILSLSNVVEVDRFPVLAQWREAFVHPVNVCSSTRIYGSRINLVITLVYALPVYIVISSPQRGLVAVLRRWACQPQRVDPRMRVVHVRRRRRRIRRHTQRIRRRVRRRYRIVVTETVVMQPRLRIHMLPSEGERRGGALPRGGAPQRRGQPPGDLVVIRANQPRWRASPLPNAGPICPLATETTSTASPESCAISGEHWTETRTSW